MEKYIYNEKNGLWYELQGDYYLPCLKLPEDGTVHIGIWGQRHRRYLKTHRKTLYTSLLTSGKLNSYLADINRQAEELFFRLVKQMAEAEGVTETLKADDPKIAETIVQNTTSKNQKVLTMDSMQSTTSKDVKNGTTYLSVMEKNLSVLKEALG